MQDEIFEPKKPGFITVEELAKWFGVKPNLIRSFFIKRNEKNPRLPMPERLFDVKKHLFAWSIEVLSAHRRANLKDWKSVVASCAKSRTNIRSKKRTLQDVDRLFTALGQKRETTAPPRAKPNVDLKALRSTIERNLKALKTWRSPHADK